MNFRNSENFLDKKKSVDRLSGYLSFIPPSTSKSLSISYPPTLGPSPMSSPKEIVLGDHKAILLDYEEDYRQSKGNDRQKVVADIIDEISSQGKGKKKHAMKGIEQVSELLY